MRATTCLLAAVLVLQAAPASDKETATIRRLVAALASPDFRERETAFRELDRLGESALDGLRTAATTGDAETRRRAAELVERIHRRQTTARVLTPAFVSLTYDNTPLAEAAADLARRTGAPISLHGDVSRFRDRTVTVICPKATYWQAVQLFCHRAGLGEWNGQAKLPPLIEPPSSQLEAAPADGVLVLGQLNVRRGQVSAMTVPSPVGRIVLLNGPHRPLPTHQAGAVRIRALPLGVSFAADAGKDQFVVLDVTAEPRLRIDGATDLRIERAIDEHGRARDARPLWADPSDQRDDWRAPRLPREVTERRCGPVAVRLTDGDQSTKRLRELAGVVTVQSFAAERVAEIARPAEAVRRTTRGAGGIAVTILSVGVASDGEVRIAAEAQLPYGVRLDLPLTGPVGVGNRGNGFGRGWAGFQPDPEPNSVCGDAYQGLALEDATGRPWPVTTGLTEIVGLFPQWFTVRVTATFRAPAAGAEAARVGFSVRRPTAVDVPFVLRDIPLP
jgi:hypothetical protein